MTTTLRFKVSGMNDQEIQEQIIARCEAYFPQGGWKVHSVEAAPNERFPEKWVADVLATSYFHPR